MPNRLAIILIFLSAATTYAVTLAAFVAMGIPVRPANIVVMALLVTAGLGLFVDVLVAESAKQSGNIGP